jgi:DNA-binding PucR family transcriptional regulator
VLADVAVPLGVRCASLRDVAPLEAPQAWRRVRNALRFAVPSTHDSAPYPIAEATVVDATRVGAYAILAEQLTADELARVEDVQRLEQLCRESGPDILPTLLAVAATDSLRRAAATVHMHHNSVAHRVRRAERALGFKCTEPYGRARLLLVLTLHRLLESHKHF